MLLLDYYSKPKLCSLCAAKAEIQSKTGANTGEKSNSLYNDFMNISKKLFLSLVGLTSIILLVTLLLARWSFDQGFTDFVNALEQQRLSRIASDVQSAYEQGDNAWNKSSITAVEHVLYLHATNLPGKRSFEGPRNRPSPQQDFPPPNRGRPNKGGTGMDMRGPPPRPGLSADIVTALYTIDGRKIAGVEPDAATMNKAIFTELTVEYQAQAIGVLKSWNNDEFGSSMGSEFSQQQLFTSLWIGFGCLLLTSVLSFYWSKALLNPIRSAMQGIKRLSSGKYNVAIEHNRKDEFGALINNVNALAHTLEQTKSAKSRWFADISHELRTPLSILLGEIEAMQMEIRPLSMENIQSLEQEALLLKRLIEDLYQLSVSDIGALRYEFASFDLSTLAQRHCDNASQIAKQNNIKFSSCVVQAVSFAGDENRISQLLNNLLTNTIKYTDAGGESRFTLQSNAQFIEITIEDSAPTVTQEDCELLFEPLYRTEKSRTRDQGGAGLGLAICKNIVVAHKGEISASLSSLGGLIIYVKLPRT